MRTALLAVQVPRGGGGGTPYVMGDTYVPRFWPPFSLWQDRARSFWCIFSHPPTPKRSFGVLKLPILTEFDLLGPKFHFSLDLFGSNFQRPAAHPHHFSDRVPPPPPPGPGPPIDARKALKGCNITFFPCIPSKLVNVTCPYITHCTHVYRYIPR